MKEDKHQEIFESHQESTLKIVQICFLHNYAECADGKYFYACPCRSLIPKNKTCSVCLAPSKPISNIALDCDQNGTLCHNFVHRRQDPFQLVLFGLPLLWKSITIHSSCFVFVAPPSVLEGDFFFSLFLFKILFFFFIVFLSHKHTCLVRGKIEGRKWKEIDFFKSFMFNFFCFLEDERRMEWSKIPS